METKLTERQKEFLNVLIDCKLSMNTLLAVGAVIDTDKKIAEFCRRLKKEMDSGKQITNGLVGQILTDMMTESLV